MDRVGARLVLGMILLGQVVAEVALAWAHNTLTALPAVLIYGATWAPMFGAISTMLNGLTVEPALKQRAFAVNFATQNMALGIGAAVAAVVVRAHHPWDLPGALPCQRPLLSSFRGIAARAAEPAANKGSQ